jgi:hypothetical protein
VPTTRPSPLSPHCLTASVEPDVRRLTALPIRYPETPLGAVSTCTWFTAKHRHLP